jgi:hypothetical protein
MKKLLALMLCLVFTGCASDERSKHIDAIVELLRGGAARLQCYAAIDQPKNHQGVTPNYKVASNCDLLSSPLEVKVLHDRVTAINRCSYNGGEIEFQVTVYEEESANDYFGGYYCSVWQEKTMSQYKLGEKTVSPNPW